MKINVESAQSAQAKLNKLINQLTPKRIKLASVILAAILTLGGVVYTMTGVAAAGNDLASQAAAASEKNEYEPTKMHERFSSIVFNGIAITTKSMLTNPDIMTTHKDKNQSANGEYDDLSLRWLAQSYQYVISLRTSSIDNSITSLTVGEGKNNSSEYVKVGSATFNIDNTANGFSKTFEAVTSLCKMIAAFWMIGLAILSYLQAQQKETASKDLIYKLIIQIAVTGMIIASSEYILEFILILGNHIACQGVFGITEGLKIDDYQSGVFQCWPQLTLALAGEAGTVNKTDFGILFEAAHSIGTVTSIGVTAQLLIPAATIILIDIVSKFVLIQYVLELGIRRALFPLSLADIAQEGLRSRGMMWIKSIFAVFIKIIVCAIVGVLCGAIGKIMLASNSGAGDFIKNGFPFCINQAIVGFTCLGTMLKAGGYVDKLLGTS